MGGINSWAWRVPFSSFEKARGGYVKAGAAAAAAAGACLNLLGLLFKSRCRVETSSVIKQPMTISSTAWKSLIILEEMSRLFTYV